MRKKIKLDFMDDCFSLLKRKYDIKLLKIIAILSDIERFRAQTVKNPVYLETILLMFELDKTINEMVIFVFYLMIQCFFKEIHWFCKILHNLMETDNEENIEIILEYDFFGQMVLFLPSLSEVDTIEILKALICILEWLELPQKRSYYKKFENLGCGPTFRELVNRPNYNIGCNARKICELCKIFPGTI